MKVRDTCAKLNSSYQITGMQAMKNLNLKEIKNNNRELATITVRDILVLNNLF